MKKPIIKQPLTALEILTNLIKEFEGCKLTAYYCPARKLTIGWGHIGKDVKPGLTWTQEQADESLHDTAIECLNESIISSPVLALNGMYKHAAIADFIYNFGMTKYNSSTLKKYVDTKQWHLASDEIKKWVHDSEGNVLNGLVKRRQAESELLFS